MFVQVFNMKPNSKFNRFSHVERMQPEGFQSVVERGNRVGIAHRAEFGRSAALCDNIAGTPSARIHRPSVLV